MNFEAVWLPCPRCGWCELTRECTCLPWLDPEQRMLMEARVAERHRQARQRWVDHTPLVDLRRAA